jgi:hypothetical protein
MWLSLCVTRPSPPPHPPPPPPVLTLLQEHVPLGVDLRTAPLHGTDGVLPDSEFGQTPPYIPKKIALPGLQGVFSGISNIFSDKQVDQHHKHFP